MQRPLIPPMGPQGPCRVWRGNLRRAGCWSCGGGLGAASDVKPCLQLPPWRTAAAAAPSACHADSAAPAPHFPPPYAGSAADASRAGPPERMRPNSAPCTLAAFLSRCCLRCRCRQVCRIAPDSNRTACTGRPVEVRFPCLQRLIWCLASAVRAIRFAIFEPAPSAGPARGQSEAGRLRNNTR